MHIWRCFGNSSWGRLDQGTSNGPLQAAIRHQLLVPWPLAAAVPAEPAQAFEPALPPETALSAEAALPAEAAPTALLAGTALLTRTALLTGTALQHELCVPVQHAEQPEFA